jgi:predicted lactoylglutathione lyase
MKLGQVVQIAVGVVDLDESAAFYETLGFEKLAEDDVPWPWQQFTDGQNLLLLNQDGNQYIGLNYFSPNLPELVAQMEEMGVEFLQKQEVDGRLQTAVFSDSDGLLVGLVNQDLDGIQLPDGEPVSQCGKFGEFALGVADFQKASHFWQQFGFEQLYVGGDPYPWGILSDGMIVVGLHQTDAFGGPCMTYFAADMPKRIAKLQSKGLSIEDGVLQAPGGETLFLFEGDV